MTEFIYRNNNILQSEGNTSNPPQETSREHLQPISVRCPHCSHQGMFRAVTSGVQYHKQVVAKNPTISTVNATIRICPNEQCNGIVFSVLDGKNRQTILPSELIDFEAVHLPEGLITTLREAISCHSVKAYRASAMMVRRLLEEICEDNDAQGKTLHDRLGDLKKKITMPQELFEAMGELKALGNDAAHIIAKNYDRIGEDESADSIESGLGKHV